MTDIGSRAHYTSLHSKINQKWRGDAATGAVDDYKQLLIYLISEQYEVVLNYAQQAEKSNIYAKPIATKLNRVKCIWEKVISHRELIIRASTVSVKPSK